jgi:hypothetical protein
MTNKEELKKWEERIVNHVKKRSMKPDNIAGFEEIMKEERRTFPLEKLLRMGTDLQGFPLDFVHTRDYPTKIKEGLLETGDFKILSYSDDFYCSPWGFNGRYQLKHIVTNMPITISDCGEYDIIKDVINNKIIRPLRESLGDSYWDSKIRDKKLEENKDKIDDIWGKTEEVNEGIIHVWPDVDYYKYIPKNLQNRKIEEKFKIFEEWRETLKSILRYVKKEKIRLYTIGRVSTPSIEKYPSINKNIVFSYTPRKINKPQSIEETAIKEWKDKINSYVNNELKEGKKLEHIRKIVSLEEFLNKSIINKYDLMGDSIHVEAPLTKIKEGLLNTGKFKSIQYTDSFFYNRDSFKGKFQLRHITTNIPLTIESSGLDGIEGSFEKSKIIEKEVIEPIKNELGRDYWVPKSFYKKLEENKDKIKEILGLEETEEGTIRIFIDEQRSHMNSKEEQQYEPPDGYCGDHMVLKKILLKDILEFGKKEEVSLRTATTMDFNVGRKSRRLVILPSYYPKDYFNFKE